LPKKQGGLKGFLIRCSYRPMLFRGQIWPRLYSFPRFCMQSQMQAQRHHSGVPLTTCPVPLPSPARSAELNNEPDGPCIWVARTIARIPAWIAGGSIGQVLTTSAKSGGSSGASWGVGEESVPDSVPPAGEICGLSAESADCSHPLGGFSGSCVRLQAVAIARSSLAGRTLGHCPLWLPATPRVRLLCRICRFFCRAAVTSDHSVGVLSRELQVVLGGMGWEWPIQAQTM